MLYMKRNYQLKFNPNKQIFIYKNIMKKLVEFIKNLFVKVDKLEQEVEQMVEKSNTSPEVKAKVKKVLKKIDAVEEQVKETVTEAVAQVEVAVEVVKKKKRYYRPKKK